MKRFRLARAALAALAMMVFPLACNDSPTGLGGDQAAMVLTASVVGTPISTLVVEITAADITVPIVTNLSIVAGVASGTLKMPPGTQRTITVKAFDNTGQITHQGSKTVDVARGNGNPAVNVPMVAKSGHVAITVTIGPVSVVIAPSASTLTAGQTLQMVATITTPDGSVLNETPDWATTNPAFATVNGSGLVTGLLAGSVNIVASYAGVAALRPLTITPSNINLAPIADAGINRLVRFGPVNTVTLDGSASSDPEGTSLTYSWTLVYATSGLSAPVTLSGVSPSVPGPGAVGTLEYDLIVSDGVNASAADRVRIQVVTDVLKAVFVSVSGDDANAGTQEQPKRTIGAGISLATLLGNGSGVYISGGNFAETPVLATGVSLYGGYEDNSWRRDPTANVTNLNTSAAGLRGTSVSSVALDGLNIHSADAVGSGASSYGLFLTGSSVNVNDVEITAGRGANGQSGFTGPNGTNGNPGQPGISGCDGCSGLGSGGFGGAGPQPGGNGGSGGYDGGSGAPGATAPQGGIGGPGGFSSGVCFSVSDAGLSGQNGSVGPNGIPGLGGSSLGLISPAGYTASNGTAGTSASNGRGGGGGGGGGGGASNVFCNADRGGGGGGGGAGGIAGLPGTGGGGGGGSFGIYLVSSTLTGKNVTLNSGQGGNGGAGGVAGQSGIGGVGGLGGFGRDDSGAGGRGGDGAPAGISGNGGGGGGGPSFALVLASGSTQTLTSSNATAGFGGIGGAGIGGAPSGMTGASGITH